MVVIEERLRDLVYSVKLGIDKVEQRFLVRGLEDSRSSDSGGNAIDVLPFEIHEFATRRTRCWGHDWVVAMAKQFLIAIKLVGESLTNDYGAFDIWWLVFVRTNS